MPYEYNACIKRVIDGDTIVVDLDLGFDVILKNQSIRLKGVDTPESRTRDEIEKIFGNLAKEYVLDFCFHCNGKIIVQTELDETGKFGRILGTIINPEDRESILNDKLINNFYGVHYIGQNKKEVQDQHLLNRKRLIDAGIVDISYAEAGINIDESRIN